ncbi:MAG: CapA family protein [Clostridium sp.]|nr:CapA family protein [Acetatifactor muris]MCM1527248.1 CapA family protein [Bacteroides sp.]MCM1563057.1 CapA family protein [Clostridium sp.]
MKKAITVIMASVCAGAVLYLLWLWGVFLPGWIVWDSGTWEGQGGAYEISLQRGRVRVTKSDIEGDAKGGASRDPLIWTSPDGVKVQAVLSRDIDGDSREELILLCWKIGRYGKYRPFWVGQDERKWSQHIYVYEYGEGEIRPKWMSSYIGQDVVRMETGNRGTSFEHLLLTDPEGMVSSWVWNSWGFTREETEVTFVAFGDNLIHAPIYGYGLRAGGSFDFLFEGVADEIANSDVAVINQETPLTDDPAMYGDYPRFGTPAQVGQAIADAGFDIVTCATNHALDRGAEGVDFTKRFLEENGLRCLGIQASDEKDCAPVEIMTRNGMRFALVNYSYGTNGIALPEENPFMVRLLADENIVREELAGAAEDADMVIVFAHWGTEYAGEPDDFQREWAQVFLECGVDVVIGTHPHALQSYEMLRGEDGHEMLIYYSLGDFVSTRIEEDHPQGGMARFTISLTSEGCRVTEYDLQPLEITRGEDGAYRVKPWREGAE